VRGVPLADLVRARFRVGEVVLEGVQVCAPCRYLVRVSGQATIFDALFKRGGLRARVVGEGVLRAGDAVEPA
jgi:MOSC domain-containing protein YiiM